MSLGNWIQALQLKREGKRGRLGFKGTDRRELELQNLTSLSLFSLQNPFILPAIAMPILFEHSAVLACSPVQSNCFSSVPSNWSRFSSFRSSQKKAQEPALAQKQNRKNQREGLLFLGHKPFFKSAEREDKKDF